MAGRALADRLMPMLVPVLLAACPCALAQRAPDPPPPPNPDDARFRELELPPGFVDQYVAAGSPRLLFVSHSLYLAGGATKTLDEAALLDEFGARLQQRFVADPRITVVDVPTAPFREKAEFDALAHNDLYEAARLLGRETRSDVVVLVVFTERPKQAGGALYSASYVMADVNRGRRIGVHTFDVRPGVDGFEPGSAGRLTSDRIQDYARALTRRVTEDFGRAYPKDGPIAGGRSYALRLASVEAARVGDVRDAIRAVPNVLSVGRVQFEEREGQTLASFDVVWSGEPIDLALRASHAASQALNAEVTFKSTREGSVVLDVGAPFSQEAAAQAPPRPQSLRGDTKAAETPPVRRFQESYATAGTPRVALFLSPIQRDVWERDYWGSGTSSPGIGVEGDRNVTVIVAPRTNVQSAVIESPGPEVAGETSEARAVRLWRWEDDRLLSLREVEDLMIGRMKTLGVRMVTLEDSWSAIERDRVFAGGKAGAVDLARELGKRGNADIVISGVGAVVRERGTPAGRPSELRLTFRAIRVSDGEILATATSSRPLDDSFFDGPRSQAAWPVWSIDWQDAPELRKSLAADATGRLAAGLEQAWGAPRSLTVRVDKVSGIGDLQKLADWLRTNVPGVQAARVQGFAVGDAGDSGVIELVGKGSTDEVTRALSGASSFAQFGQVTGATSDEVVVRMNGPVP